MNQKLIELAEILDKFSTWFIAFGLGVALCFGFNLGCMIRVWSTWANEGITDVIEQAVVAASVGWLSSIECIGAALLASLFWVVVSTIVVDVIRFKMKKEEKTENEEVEE